MLVLALLILTLLCAFYAGSEAAIFSHDLTQVERAYSRDFNPRLRRTVAGWLRRPERVITGLLLGNLIASILLTELGETWIKKQFGDFPESHFVLPVIITLYVLTFGEVIPKIVALVFKSRWVRIFQIPLRFWLRVAAKITQPVDQLASAMVKRIKAVGTNLGEKELVEAVRFAEDHGLLKGDEMRMLSRSIAFYHNTVYAAMVPRSQLLLLREGTSTQKSRRAFQGSAYNFAGIYAGHSREIIGVVHLRGIVQLMLTRKKEISSKVHEISFLPASMSLSDALTQMMASRRDLAGVVDEAGAFIGMVTLKTIMHHILGASFSASLGGAYIEELESAGGVGGGRRYRVQGQMPLDRFNETFRTAYSATLSETIGGFILERFDGFPHADDNLELDRLTFKDFVLADRKIVSFVLVVRRNA